MQKQAYFYKAPLPFWGQKRNFLKKFRALIQDEFKAFASATWLDAFGGSGLLSHTIKDIYPNANVLWNDYDDYSLRLRHIKKTEALLAEIKGITCAYKQGEWISEADKQKVIQIIQRHQDTQGYVDYVSLSASLLFGGKYRGEFESFTKQRLSNIKMSRKPQTLDASGYLAGVNRLKDDGFSLIKKHKSGVLVLDPPYLNATTGNYKQGFNLQKTLSLLELVRPPYILFGSANSQILDLIDWLAKNGFKQFKDYSLITAKMTAHNGSGITGTDLMIYKIV